MDKLLAPDLFIARRPPTAGCNACWPHDSERKYKKCCLTASTGVHWPPKTANPGPERDVLAKALDTIQPPEYTRPQMAVPGFQEITLPLLRLTANGDEHLLKCAELTLPETYLELVGRINGASIPTRYPDDIRRSIKSFDSRVAREYLGRTREVVEWLKQHPTLKGSSNDSGTS